MSEFKTPKDVTDFIAKEEIGLVDLRFKDFPGLSHHFTVPSREIEESTFEEGVGFDGSSIRGWHTINESDMLVKPRTSENKTVMLRLAPPSAMGPPWDSTCSTS